MVSRRVFFTQEACTTVQIWVLSHSKEENVLFLRVIPAESLKLVKVMCTLIEDDVQNDVNLLGELWVDRFEASLDWEW